MTHIELGDRVRDEISGFEGIVTARTEYLHGATAIRVTRATENSKPEEVWLNEGFARPVAATPAPSGFARIDA